MTIYHKHHIIPRHAAGSDDPSNIIQLTVEEHAEAHRILWEEHGQWQDELAWKGLSGRIGKEKVIRKSICESNKNRIWSKESRKKTSIANLGKNNGMYGKRGPDNPNYQRKHTELSKRNMSEGRKGIPISKEHKEKLKILQTGRKHTEETRKKMRTLQSGENNGMYGRKHSESTKAKMRAAWKRRLAAKVL